MSDMDVTIFDNGGRTFDRYTVLFPDMDAFAIGSTGNVPNGVCMHVEQIGQPEGVEIDFVSLPDPVQRAIQDEWNAWYSHLI